MQQKEIDISSKTLLTLNEAAAYLGLSKSALYKMTSRKEIPYYKPCKYLYFKREELEKWVFGCRVASETEMNDEVNKRLLSK